jgi:hypothetical protein
LPAGTLAQLTVVETKSAAAIRDKTEAFMFIHRRLIFGLIKSCDMERHALRKLASVENAFSVMKVAPKRDGSRR